jgi:sugar lactone lactonase YvrE
VGCEGGRCEVQALYAPPTPDNAVDFSVGTKHLFWTNAAGQVLRSPVDGGAATVIEDEGDRVLGMAADVASVFWLATSGRQVRVADADGENIRVLATLQDQPFDLAVADADTIFVSTQGPGKILQISRTSGTVTELPTTLAGPAFLAASDNDVVWADVSAGTIGALDRATGAMSELASMQAQPQAISLRQGVAYWTNEGARSVMKRSVQGSESAVALAVVNGADALAVGASYCYFGSGTGLWRVPSAGGKLQLVASGHERIVNIVVAGGWVYFADFYDGTIARAAQ